MTALLPLESFRRIISYNPWHFWGLYGTDGVLRVTSSCNAVVKQYSWQNTDALGRSEILEAIETAETRIRSYLGYSVAPRYVTETLAWPRFYDAALTRHVPIDATGRWNSVQLGEGYVQRAGVETRTLLSAAAAVVYSDVDGDGINDTATISVATSVTDPNQIALYFATADRFENQHGSAVSEAWRIQPLRVTIAAGTATIKGPSWLFVKPVLYEGTTTSDLLATTSANYVTTVDVYRRYTDVDGNTTDTSQATLIWETTPCNGWWCCACGTASYTPTDSSADPAAIAQAIARVGIRDARNGIVTPGEAALDATTGIWSNVAFDAGFEPDRVTVRYHAGYPLYDGQMDKRWQTVVARMAAAELSRRICACDTANRELYRWQFDLAQSSGNNDEAYGAISAEDMNNPFGTRRGHVYAWREVRNLRTLRGFLP